MALSNLGLWLKKLIHLKQNFSPWFPRPDIWVQLQHDKNKGLCIRRNRVLRKHTGLDDALFTTSMQKELHFLWIHILKYIFIKKPPNKIISLKWDINLPEWQLSYYSAVQKQLLYSELIKIKRNCSQQWELLYKFHLLTHSCQTPNQNNSLYC